MDSPRESDTNVVVESERNDRGRSDGEADRDLRDVLRHLVVAGDGRESVSVSDVAGAVEGSERLVPELLAALEDEATAVRIGASWTLCALADEQPQLVEYLTERTADRVDDGSEPFEVAQVLAFLRGRYPGRAAGAVDVAVDESLEHPTGPDGQRIETDGGVPAGTVADLGDNRQVVRPDGGPTAVHDRTASPDEPGPRGDAPTGPGRSGGAGPTAPERESASTPSGRGCESAPDRGRGPTTGAETPTDHPTHPDFESSDESPVAASNASRGVEPAADSQGVEPAGPKSPPVTDDEYRPETPETFASIAALSPFDQLSAVDEGVEDRYARAYRSRAVLDGDERGVGVRLFDRPDERDRLEFCGELTDALARWETLGGEKHVVGVVEWGERPRPWVATDPVAESLADRDRPPVDEGLWEALALAKAVGYLHHHGAVHGGIDPKNVVYPGDAFADRVRPMLDNVGLMGPFRQYFDPRAYLDPRYAAPEYFDDSYGCVDAATDVYHVGAVCYDLLTGKPPFTGCFREIRQRVLETTPTPPSQVNDAVPPKLDAILVKAMAKRKLTRYESVEALYGDLEQVRARQG